MYDLIWTESKLVWPQNLCTESTVLFCLKALGEQCSRYLIRPLHSAPFAWHHLKTHTKPYKYNWNHRVLLSGPIPFRPRGKPLSSTGCSSEFACFLYVYITMCRGVFHVLNFTCSREGDTTEKKARRTATFYKTFPYTLSHAASTTTSYEWGKWAFDGGHNLLKVTQLTRTRV